MAVSKLTPAHIAIRIAARRDRTPAPTGQPPATLTSAPTDHPLQRRQGGVLLAAGTVAAGEDASVVHDGGLSVLNVGAWRRECFILPPEKARETAAAWLDRYPRARWRSEIENWRVVGDDLVQVILRRLPDVKSPG